MGRIRLIVIAAVAAALSPLVTSEPAAAAHQPGASSPVVAADQVSAARQRASRYAEGLPFYDVRVASPTAANSASGQPAGVHVSRGMRAARAKLTRSLGRRGSVEVNPNTGTVRAMQRLNGTLTAPSGVGRRRSRGAMSGITPPRSVSTMRTSAPSTSRVGRSLRTG
jgi:hypothetical protein